MNISKDIVAALNRAQDTRGTAAFYENLQEVERLQNIEKIISF